MLILHQIPPKWLISGTGFVFLEKNLTTTLEETFPTG